MELKIKTKKKAVKKTTDTFELFINFMEGDADGYQSCKLKVKSKHYNKNPDVKRVFHDIINVVESCCNAYPNGRGGYDEYDSVPGYVKFFKRELDNVDYEFLFMKDLVDLSEEAYETALQEKIKQYQEDSERDWEIIDEYFKGYLDHPSDSNYISTSFNYWGVRYFNEDGDKLEVGVKFTDEDKELHEYCKENIT